MYKEKMTNNPPSNFQLTDAVRPYYDGDTFKSGYRHAEYFDEESKQKIPVIMISASAEKLMDLFLDLLDPLGKTIDIVLETSHNSEKYDHEDHYREHMDLSVFKSMCMDYEDLLLNDGFTGIAALNPQTPAEVQFDEHKILIIYAMDLSPFEAVLKKHNIPYMPDIRLITEAEHIHRREEEHTLRFQQFLADTTGATPILPKPTDLNLDQIFNTSDIDNDPDNKNEPNSDQNPKWHNDDDDGLDWTPSA